MLANKTDVNIRNQDLNIGPSIESLLLPPPSLTCSAGQMGVPPPSLPPSLTISTLNP